MCWAYVLYAWKDIVGRWKLSKNSDTEMMIEIESSTNYEYPFVSACRHRETGPMRGVGGRQQCAQVYLQFRTRKHE